MVSELPPQELNAERALLGAMIIQESVIDLVAAVLSYEDFYNTSHKAIFKTLVEMKQHSETVDLVTAYAKLEANGTLKGKAGRDALMDIEDAVPAVANAEYYARLIKDASSKRALIKVGHQLQQQGYDSKTTPKEIISAVEAQLCGIGSGGGLKVVSLGDALVDAFNELKDRHSGKLKGVSTGFVDLDEYTGGFHRGELILLAGRPSVGKSTLAWNLVERIAMQGKVPTLFFSLEVGYTQCGKNILIQLSKVGGHKVRKTQLGDDDWGPLGDVMNSHGVCPVQIVDSPILDIGEMMSYARRFKMSHDIGFIVVDYLQLMSASNFESQQHKVSMISVGLKAIARELNIPVLALSQLNRSIEYRGDNAPKLSDLRDSGSLEQDADVVLLMHRPKVDDEADSPRVVVNIAKQRAGETVNVQLLFKKNDMRFEDLYKADYIPWQKL